MLDKYSKGGLMVSSIACASIAVSAPGASPTDKRANRRRRIPPEAGHALEILGHAIEYLADEYVHEGGSLSAHDPRLEAIQMLMALNRKIYFACPLVPTLGERLRAWLHRIHPWPHRELKLHR